MTRNQKIFSGIDAIVKSKKLDRTFIVQGIEEALIITIKKTYGYDNVEVQVNYDTKRIIMNAYKTVTEDGNVIDQGNQMEISEALGIKKSVEVGDEIKIKVKLEKDILERAIVQSAKQVFRQKLKEAEYKKILEIYGEEIGGVTTGYVEEIKEPFIYFKLDGDILATLGPKGRIKGETLEPDLPIKLVIDTIAPQSKKGPKIIVSRTSPKLVYSAMAEVIPEIESGTLKVASVAREAGSRSKVAIELVDLESDIDVLGVCIGTSGQRINEVKTLLGGENIDIIEKFDDPIIYISNALAPALVIAVKILDEEKRTSQIIVPDDQFSLAIGVDGQNVRLASLLTGWKIDIKSQSQAIEEGISYEEDII